MLGAQKIVARSTRDHQQKLKEALGAPVEEEGRVDSVVGDLRVVPSSAITL